MNWHLQAKPNASIMRPTERQLCQLARDVNYAAPIAAQAEAQAEAEAAAIQSSSSKHPKRNKQLVHLHLFSLSAAALGLNQLHASELIGATQAAPVCLLHLPVFLSLSLCLWPSKCFITHSRAL